MLPLPDHGVGKDVNAKLRSIVKSFDSLVLHAWALIATLLGGRGPSTSLRKACASLLNALLTAQSRFSGASSFRQRLRAYSGIHDLRDLEVKIRASLMAEDCTLE